MDRPTLSQIAGYDPVPSVITISWWGDYYLYLSDRDFESVMNCINALRTILEKNLETYNRDAVVYEHTPGAYTSLTFERLFQLSTETSDTLKALNLQSGAIVAFSLENSPQFIVLLLALLQSNLVAAPLSPTLSETTHTILCSQLGASALITDLRGKAEVGSGITVLDRSLQGIIFSVEIQSRPQNLIDTPAVVRFTSGTTGTAKAVLLSHRTINERIELASKGLRLTEGMRILPTLPMAYHFVVSLLTYLRAGATTIIPLSFDPQAVAHAAVGQKADMLYGSPSTFDGLSTLTPIPQFCTGTRFISTTYALAPRARNVFEDRMRAHLEEYFGIFEVGLPLGPCNQNDAGEKVSKPLPGYEVEVLLEDTHVAAPIETVGMLAVKGPGLFDGYLTLTFSPRKEHLVGEWFLTGDLATKSASGGITVLGRASLAVKLSGHYVIPERIENALKDIGGISEAYVYIQGNTICAEVVGDESLTEDQIITRISTTLSPWEIPSMIQWVTEIPLTDSGKIQRARG